MSEILEYKVLARKYRPQKFKNLIGQNTLVEILSNAILKNRLAHAYVLNGVRGVGKTTTARIIAMSINCKEKQVNDFEPCGNCKSCTSIGSDGNLDVIEMDAASNTGVDDVREIIDNVKYKPILGDFKIFIIDEVHMLSKSAFNALLKTLEEPPGHVKFIFATTELKKIPITVLSRCQRFDLHRIENKILSEYINKIAKLEKINIETDAVSLIVRSADGSVRDALSLLDQAISNEKPKIDSDHIIEMLGLADREKIFNLLTSILKGDSADSLSIYRKLYDLGSDVNMIFDELLNVVHFLIQFKIAPEIKNDVYIPESERNIGEELSANVSLNNLNIIWQILFKGYQELQSGIHLFQHGEMIILRLIYLFDGESPDDLIKKIKKKENKENTRSYSEENNNNLQGDKIININKTKNRIDDNVKLGKDYTEIKDFRQFVDMFYINREGLLHTKLYNDATLISFKDGDVTLNLDKILDKTFSRTIAKLISKWTGRIWQVNSSTSNLGKSLHEEDIINQQKQIDIMKNDKEIKKILYEFPESEIHTITEISDINTQQDFVNINFKKEK